MRLLSRLLPALLLTLSTNFAFAITNTFTGTGNWSDASKWSHGVPPRIYIGDVIIIAGNCTYDLPGSYGVDGELRILSTGVLNIVSRHFEIHGGTVNIEGTLINSHQMGNHGGTVNISGTVTGTGHWQTNSSFNILSGGNFTASGSFWIEAYINVHPGGTFTNKGAIGRNLLVNGSIFNNGSISATEGYKHVVTGNYTASSSAIHRWNIGGNLPGKHDVLEVGGTATLNGTLEVSLINYYLPLPQDSLIIVKGAISGAFSTVNIPSQYTVVYNPNSVALVHKTRLTKPHTSAYWGTEAYQSNISGYNNTAFGYRTLSSNTSGVGNAAHGASALSSNTSGGNNTAQGFNALYSNTVGSGLTAIGANALYSNTAGVQNTAIGFNALFANTGSVQ